jgi:hypothetical protein
VDPGWIWTGNLRPFLVELGRLTGCGFDDADWAAVEYGVQGTDSEAGPWFEYPVGRFAVALALEPAADEMVTVKAHGAIPAEEERIRWLGDLMREWRLS